MLSMEFRVITGTEEAEQQPGGSLVGHLVTTYDRLVELFGEPLIYEDYQFMGACEWVVLFPDGTYTRISPLRIIPEPPTEPYGWHVGGNRLTSLAYLSNLMQLPCIFTANEDPEIGCAEIPF